MRRFGHESPLVPNRSEVRFELLAGGLPAVGGDIQGTAHGVQLLRATGGDALTDEAVGHSVRVVEIEDALPRQPASSGPSGPRLADRGSW